MKKRIIALMLCMTTILAFNGCGNARTQDTEQSTENAKATYNGPSSAKMDIDLEKQVSKLADYKGIDVTISGNYDVTDEDVEKNMLSLLPYYGITGIEIKDRDTVQKGDYVKVDYTGYLDGKAFDGGSATDIMLDVDNNYDVTNQNSYIDGFCDGIVGSKVGSEISTDVTFPDNYNETLGGKKTTFKIKINAINETEYPEFDDELIKDTTEFDTVDEWKEDIKKTLEDRAESRAESEFENYIMETLIKNVDAVIPKCMFDHRVDSLIRNFEHNLKHQGMSVEIYLQYTGMDMDSFRETFEDRAENEVKLRLALEKIAELENIEISEDEINSQLQEIADANNLSLDDVKNRLPMDDFLTDLKVNKALDLVKDNAVIDNTIDPSKKDEEAEEAAE